MIKLTGNTHVLLGGDIKNIDHTKTDFRINHMTGECGNGGTQHGAISNQKAGQRFLHNNDGIFRQRSIYNFRSGGTAINQNRNQYTQTYLYAIRRI